MTSQITVGILSDEHIRKSSRQEITALDDQSERYQQFADAMNNEVNADFVIQQGDLPDGCQQSCTNIVSEDTAVDRIKKGKELIHDRLDMPVYDVMGNHEYRDPDWDKARIRKAIDDNWEETSDTWYEFTKNEFKFVVLNTAYTDAVSGNHTAPYEELWWFDEVLNKTNRPTFVFMHVPAFKGCGGEYDQFTNEAEVRYILSKHNNVVAGFFGHSHHCDSWDRMRVEQDYRGTRYYHTTAPHQWMGDPSQIPWSILTISKDEFTFATGSGVTSAGDFQTQWTHPINNHKGEKSRGNGKVRGGEAT